jgi:multiple sugar transport system substrate-binding protein
LRYVNEYLGEKYMKHSYKLLSFVLVALLLLSVSAASAQDAVKLSFWSRDSDEGLVRGLVDAWNASHTNQIEVTIIPAADFVTKIGTAIAGGAAPDIMAIDLIYAPRLRQQIS